jgi:hypothetical protein
MSHLVDEANLILRNVAKENWTADNESRVLHLAVKIVNEKVHAQLQITLDQINSMNHNGTLDDLLYVIHQIVE